MLQGLRRLPGASRGGGRGTPIMDYTGRLRPKEVPLSEVRISLVAVYERVEKSVISICKSVKKR